MRNKKPKNSGFTLVELLIVIAIVGILAAVVLVNLNSARNRSRDTKRVADARQVLTALELYFQDNGGYPTPDIASLTGPDLNSGNPAWSTFLVNWPVAPIPADNPTGFATCTSTGAGTGTNQYTYTQISSGADFNMTFCIGSQVGNYAPGMHTVSASGIQ